MVRLVLACLVGLLSLAYSPATYGVGTNQDGPISAQVSSGSDVLEAREYFISDSSASAARRQTITAWRVNAGTWNGISLDGLSLILVKNIPADARLSPTTNCYISYPASPAQKQALLSAYAASKSISTSEVNTWRVESALIRFEFEGQSVTIHIGMIA